MVNGNDFKLTRCLLEERVLVVLLKYWHASTSAGWQWSLKKYIIKLKVFKISQNDLRTYIFDYHLRPVDVV